MFCRFDGFHHDCESELCADCSVFLQWEESMRNVREIKWFDPKEVLPSMPEFAALAIVEDEYRGYSCKSYKVVCFLDGEWLFEHEKVNVRWWCELPDAPEEKI